MSETKPRGSDTRPKSGLRSWSADGHVWRGKKRALSARDDPGILTAETGEAVDGGVRSTSCPRRRRERKCSCGALGDAEADLLPCRSKAMSRRSLRQKFQDAVGQCLPLRSQHHHHHHHHRHHHHRQHAPGSSRPFSVLLWSKRKIHVSELMQDTCPFSPKSELAHCWHLIKKHPTPPQPVTVKGGTGSTPPQPVTVNGGTGSTPPQPVTVKGGTGSTPPQPVTVNGGTGSTPPQPVTVNGGTGSTSPPQPPPPSAPQSSPPITPISWEDVCSPGPAGSGSLDDWDPSCPHGGPRSSCSCCSHTDYILVPDLLQINNSPCYWGVLNRFEAEELLEGHPEGTFLLRDSAQDEYLFSVSFRRYSRSLHARIEQSGKRFSFDGRDPCMYRDASVTGLLRHYSDPAACLFFEPLLSRPLARTFPFSLQHLCRAAVCSLTTYPGIDGLPLPAQLRDYLRQYHIKCNGACAV